MNSIRKALVLSVLTQHSIQIIGLVTIVTLARLLTPAEVGVFAVAASVAFLALELRALGVGQYLIREEHLSADKIRSATGLVFIISWGMALIIVISAPYIAEFYNEDALKTIFWIISGTFFLTPFTSVPSALLTRDLQFKPLFVVRLTSRVTSSVGSIGFVLLGYSYYGLAMGALAGVVAEVIIISYYRPANTPWMPSFSNLRSLLRFGIFTSMANTLQQFSISIPDLVLGRVATMTDVGLFSRGLGVIVFLNKILGQAVAPVVLPHLSEVKRSGGSVAEAYLQAIKLQAAFCWPIFAVVNVCSFTLIRAMFGDQWDAAVPIASVLAIWAILQSTHGFSSFALLAEGKERAMLNKEVIVFSARLVAVLLSAPYGMLMVAWGMVFAGLVELIVNTWVVKHAVGIGIRRFLKEFLPNVVIMVACWGSMLLLDLLVDLKGLSPWLSVAIIGISMLIVWLIALRLTKHEAWTLVVQMFGRVKKSTG